MQATDMRKLSRDARHERRVQVIRLRKTGQTYEQIAAQTGLSRTGVFNICKRHEAAGAKALRDAPSGRKSGDGRLLDAAQEAMVRKLITDKTPDQLKMPYALWTRTAVSQLIAPGGYDPTVLVDGVAARAAELGITGLHVRARSQLASGSSPGHRMHPIDHQPDTVPAAARLAPPRLRTGRGVAYRCCESSSESVAAQKGGRPTSTS